MDTVDVRILRELLYHGGHCPFQSDIRKSYRTIGNNLGVDESTIRTRIGRLRDSGFLSGPGRILPNPSLFGVRSAHARFRVDWRGRTSRGEDSRALLEQLKMVDGVWLVIRYLKAPIRVVFFFEDDYSLKRQIQLMRTITGCRDGDVTCREISFPVCTMSPAQIDWNLVRSIEKNPSKTFDEVSDELIVSNKTAKKRLERMVESNALFLVPNLNPLALEGALWADLMVLFQSPEAKSMSVSEIEKRLDDCFVSAQFGDPDHVDLKLLLTSVSRGDEICQWVGQLNGVAKVFFDLVSERTELFEEISRRISKMGLKENIAAVA